MVPLKTPLASDRSYGERRAGLSSLGRSDRRALPSASGRHLGPDRGFGMVRGRGRVVLAVTVAEFRQWLSLRPPQPDASAGRAGEADASGPASS